MLGGRHFTHAFLLPVCASYDFGGKKEKDNLLVGVGGSWGKEKKLFCLGFGKFLQMQ